MMRGLSHRTTQTDPHLKHTSNISPKYSLCYLSTSVMFARMSSHLSILEADEPLLPPSKVVCKLSRSFSSSSLLLSLPFFHASFSLKLWWHSSTDGTASRHSDASCDIIQPHFFYFFLWRVKSPYPRHHFSLTYALNTSTNLFRRVHHAAFHHFPTFIDIQNREVCKPLSDRFAFIHLIYTSS